MTPSPTPEIRNSGGRRGDAKYINCAKKKSKCCAAKNTPSDDATRTSYANRPPLPLPLPLQSRSQSCACPRTAEQAARLS